MRQSVSELLCRVGQDAPHLIVYPAVVGCSTSLPKYLLNKGKEGEGRNSLLIRGILFAIFTSRNIFCLEKKIYPILKILFFHSLFSSCIDIVKRLEITTRIWEYLRMKDFRINSTNSTD